MGIRTTTDRILSDLQAVCAEHALDGRAVGLALWSLHLGEAPAAPFDEPGPERDALLRFQWLLLIRFPAQQKTGFVTAALRLEMMMEGLEPLEQVVADLREAAGFSGDFVADERLPASWNHSANALRDVLRRSDDALLLLYLRPQRDLQPDRNAPRVAALEARVDDRLRRYLDTGDPALTVVPEAGRDRAAYGLHLAWSGALEAGLVAIEQAATEGLPAGIGARMRANTLLGAGQYERALPAFERILELDPAADAAYDMAICLTRLGRDAEADVAYGRAAELDPSWVDPLWNRGKLRMERLNDVEGARSDTEAAIALDPRNADLRYNLAVVDRMAGDLPRSVVHLGEALRLAPNDPKILVDRARTHFDLGQPEAALSDARRALAQQDSMDGRILEAKALHALGRSAEAVEAWDRVLRGRRGAAPAYLESAEADACSGHPERAISRYREALRAAQEGSSVIAKAEAALEALGYDGPRTWPLPELDDKPSMERARRSAPERTAARKAIIDEAEARMQQQRFEDARDVLRAAIAESEAPELWLALGTVHRNLGDARGAVEAFDCAIALDPDRVLPRVAKAQLCSMVGRPDLAIDVWTGVLERAPNVAEAWHARGSDLQSAGRLEEALTDLDRSLALDPALVDSHYNRAVVLTELGRMDEARSAYDRLLHIQPDDVQGRLNRATLYLQAGDAASALDDLDHLVEQRPTEGKSWAKRGAIRQLVGDHWGALFDLLVGFELLTPEQPQKEAAAFTAQEVVATIDPTEHGFPSRIALQDAAQALEDHAPYAPEEAVAAFFEELEPLLSDRADFWTARAELERGLGHPDERCAACRARALHVDPGHAYARFLQAEALLREPDPDPHEAEVRTLLKGALADSDPERDADWRLRAHLRLGRLHLDLGNPDAALEILEAGLALDESSEERERTAAHVAFLLGYARSRQGNADAALAAYTRGLALDPATSNLWFNRACEHARLCANDPSHKEPALSDLTQAMERDPRAGRKAEEDEYFRPLWSDPDFRALVAVRPADR